MRVVRFTAFLMLLAAGAVRAAPPGILIGVLSPTGRGRSVGAAHEETIRFAFDRLGPTLSANGIAVPLRVEYRSDGGDPALAVAEARALVEAGAVAILGPVDSASTEEVLRADLEVPVLSAFSSAPSLSNPRDRWFFRVTLDDTERMRQYAETLRRYDAMMPPPVLVLYDGSNPYGLGLWKGLMEALGLSEGAALPWSDAVVGGSIDDGNRDRVRAGEGFTATAEAALDPAPETVFVLGGSAGSVALANGVRERLRARGAAGSPRFFFVGADTDLRVGAPEDSYTIGEPTVVDDAGNGTGAVRAEFFRRRRLGPEDFIVTAYEAAHHILPGALTAILSEIQERGSDGQSREGLPPVRDLRRQLRERLETREFESMEPWRRIRLAGGRMSGAPAVPVYRITRRLDLVEVPVPQPWLEVDAPKEIGYLEGRVAVRLRPHSLTTKDLAVDLLRVDVTPFETVESSFIARSDDEAELTFYPWFQGGRYRVQPRMTLPMLPAEPDTVVRLGRGYGVALAGALLGSLLFVLATTRPGSRVSRWRVAQGILTGVALAAIEFHRGILPGGLPLPSLGGSPGTNAFWAGFAGGWSGPGILMLLAGRLVPSWPQKPPAEPEVPRPAPTRDAAPMELRPN
jgi:hypothetical protein